MNEVPGKITKKIQTLDQIAADLRQGEHFRITRLTMLKSLCGDADNTAAFALYIAKKTQQAMKTRSCPDHVEAESWRRRQRLAARAVRGMAKHLKEATTKTKSSLDDLLSEIRGVQNQHKHQQWGPVRIIKSRELLVVEMALECVLQPWASPDLGYRVARQYAERYNSRYGTGLIPESAPFVEDIAEFWGRHFLGRGCRRTPHICRS